MRIFKAGALGLMLIILGAATAQDDSVNALIKKLGSTVAKEREQATRDLMKRPEAAGALRKAAKAGDPEVARRATLVLDHFDQQKLAEISAAAKEGRVTQLINLVYEFPDGKYEEVLHGTLKEFAKTLSDKHVKAGGKTPIIPRGLYSFGGPTYGVKAARITEKTPGKFPGNPLFRANQFDFEIIRPGENAPPNPSWATGAIMVATGNVSIRRQHTGLILFARGNVEVDDYSNENAIAVSCGNIIWPADPSSCLLIAQGTITCGNVVVDSHLVSGKSLLRLGNRKNVTEGSTITENEPNPLGFIRWDAPNDKKKIEKASAKQ
jgi:hypothetical protein